MTQLPTPSEKALHELRHQVYERVSALPMTGFYWLMFRLCERSPNIVARHLDELAPQIGDPR